MKELTDKQARVLAFIRRYYARHGIPPTRAEISTALGFASPNAAQEHLKTLARKGAIELRASSSRGILLLDSSPASHNDLSLPLVGRVAAGAPILAVENVETHYSVSAGLFSPRPDYLLRVSGMSMVDAGILDGDLLAVHATPQAADGQIVVVRLDDEVTVKRLRRSGHTVILEAANPDYAPITVDLRRESPVVEGIAAGVIRRHPGHNPAG